MMTFLLIMIYLAFISLGLPDSLLGAAWPSMRLTLNAPLSAAGPISMIVSGGTIVSSLLSGRVIGKFGTGRVTFVSVMMTAAALLGFSLAPSYAWLCVLAVPLGLGAGAVDSGLNDFVARHYAARHMNWLHCFWGIGATCGPIVMSQSIASWGGWSIGYRIVACIQFVLVAALLFSLPIWRKMEKRDAAEAGAARAGNRARPKGMAWGILGFFFYCGGETSAFLWGASFLVESRGVGAEQAAGWVSLFFVGITVGRLLSGFLSMKLNGMRMIRLGQAGMALGALLLLIPNAYVSAAALMVLGLGCAPVFPTMLHETPRRFGEENSAHLIGLQMACAYVGCMLVPSALGWICGVVGTMAFPVLEIVFLAGQVLCCEKLNGILGWR